MFTRANVLADAKLLIGSFPVFTGENSLSDAQIELVIDQSLTTYSIDRPHLVSVIVEGVDSKRFYPLGGTDTIISGWDEEFSKIREVDLDVGSTGRALKDSGGSGIDLLGPGTTEVWTSDIPYLRFIGSRTPSGGEYFQVYYTSMHEIIDADMIAVPPIEAVNTIPNKHRHAITYLSVSKAAAIAAIRAAKALDPPSGAMYVTMKDKTKEFRSIQNSYHDMYTNDIGGANPIAASIIVSAPLQQSVSPIGFYAHRSNITINQGGGRQR